MTGAIDIYRAAKLVIDRHGEEAALSSAARTAVLAGEGDVEGAAVWRRISELIEVRMPPPQPPQTTQNYRCPSVLARE